MNELSINNAFDFSQLEKEEPFYQRETNENEDVHYGSIAFETGVGVAADFILGSPDPASRLLSFGVGYGTNAIAQWMRGDLDDFSHGEALSAGGFQAIPFGSVAKGLKGVKRATAKGIAGGIGMEQVRVGIDEQRRLTAKEVVLSGLTGGIVGGGFQAGGEVIGNTYRQFTGLTEGLGGPGIRSMEGSGRNPVNQGGIDIPYIAPQFEHSAKVLQRLFNNNLTTGGKARRFDFIKLQNDRNSIKAANDNFRRSLGVDISTAEYYKTSFTTQRTNEMGAFLALYGESMQNNQVRHYRKVPGKKKPQLVLDSTGKPELVSSPIDPSRIELDHRVTLMQSLGMYHNTEYGSDLWNDIQRIALNRMDPGTGRGYKPGDTVDNLGLVDPESHRVKTRFFNDLHGRTTFGGMKYWRGKHRDTGKTRLHIMSNSHQDGKKYKNYRKMHLEIVEDYFDHIDEGSKILDNALAIWDAEMSGDFVPDELASKLGKIALKAETYKYTPNKLKEIITDIILDSGPKRDLANWALSYGDVNPANIRQLEKFSKNDKALEMILDRAGIYADINGNTVLGRKYTDAQIKQKYFPTVSKKEVDILMTQLELSLQEIDANPQILSNIIELAKKRRGSTPGNLGYSRYTNPSDKGLE